MSLQIQLKPSMLLTACHCSAVYLSCTLVPLSLKEKNPLFCGLSAIKLLNHLFPHKHKDKCQILNRLATFGVHSDFETGMHDLLINKIYIPTKLYYFFCRITEFILNPPSDLNFISIIFNACTKYEFKSQITSIHKLVIHAHSKASESLQ